MTSKKTKRSRDEFETEPIAGPQLSTTVDEHELVSFVATLPRIAHDANNGQHQCQFCQEKFKEFKYLNDHKRREHPETYFACPDLTCRAIGGQKIFDDVRSVVTHFMREHTEKVDEKFKCGIAGCQVLLGNQNSMNKHIKQFHKDNEEFYKLAAAFYLRCHSSHVHSRPARYAKTDKN